jgi:hypothetical protein
MASLKGTGNSVLVSIAVLLFVEKTKNILQKKPPLLHTYALSGSVFGLTLVECPLKIQP